MLSFFFFSLWKENLTGKSYCCVSCLVWHTFIYPKACLILLLLWKLVISIKVAFLCRGLISVDQSYWLIANSLLASSIYILGANRLGGETTRGANRLGGKRPGGKRLGGETTRGGNGLGAKRPGFPLIMFLQASFCQVGVIRCKWIKDADTVVLKLSKLLSLWFFKSKQIMNGSSNVGSAFCNHIPE